MLRVLNRNRLLSIFASALPKSLCVFNLMLLAFISPLYAEVKEESCQLKFGYNNYPPYMLNTATGKPKGYNIDLVRDIASELNCELSFHFASFEKNQRDLRNGEIDFLANASFTEERAEYSFYSKPYRNEIIVFYVKPKHANLCENLTFEDVLKQNIKIGLTFGVFNGEEIASLEKNDEKNQQIIYGQDRSEIYNLYKENKIDALVDDPNILKHFQNNGFQSTDFYKCKVANFAPIHLMFSKKTISPEIVEKFNMVIEKVVLTDKYKRNWGW